MSYTFKNLADIELLTEMPENANKIIEVDGSIKRISDAASSAKPVIIEGTMDLETGSCSYTCTSTTYAEVKIAIENNIISEWQENKAVPHACTGHAFHIL